MFRVVAVGRFDGVHRGHQHLFAQAQVLAHERGWSSLAYTFPPRPPALLPLGAKVRLLGGLVDEVEVVDPQRVCELSAQEFLAREVVRRLSGRALVMGPDHRFGRGREGTPALARRLGKDLDLEVHVVPPFTVEGEVVSSRRIREFLGAGKVVEAAALLGRPPALFGHPIPGAGIARTLGFPTLNLELDPVLLRPRDGVYLAWAFWAGGGGPGLFYLGQRPTFPDLPPSVELHLLVPPPRIPPSALEVHLLRFVRADQRFSSAKALVERVAQDIAEAEELLPSLSPPRPILIGL